MENIYFNFKTWDEIAYEKEKKRKHWIDQAIN